MTNPTETTELKAGVLVGGIRRPLNRAANIQGSIHEDAAATKPRLRGGRVAGSVHMDVFGPLFRERWWERGTLSLYFLNPTIHAEAVRASMRLPDDLRADNQVDVWIELEDGLRVAEGTASVGNCVEPTALLRKPNYKVDTSERRMLRDVHEGDPIAPWAAL